MPGCANPWCQHDESDHFNGKDCQRCRCSLYRKPRRMPEAYARKRERSAAGGRPPDLKAAIDLGRRRPHGHKMRYMAGCRCLLCRRGNARYDAKMKRDRERYGPNDLVTTEKVLEHLAYLKSFGIGYKTVAKHARVSKTSLAGIIWYGRRHIRRRSMNRILAIVPSLNTLPRSVVIPATETQERLRQLTKWGYPYALIVRDGLGSVARGLQIHCMKFGKPDVMVKTAVKVRDFYALIVAMCKAWRESGRAIPARHYVYWKAMRGRRPEAPTAERLELRRFALTYDYAHVYSRELKEVMGLKWAVTRKLRELRKANGKQRQEQVAGSA